MFHSIMSTESLNSFRTHNSPKHNADGQRHKAEQCEPTSVVDAGPQHEQARGGENDRRQWTDGDPERAFEVAIARAQDKDGNDREESEHPKDGRRSGNECFEAAEELLPG